MSVQSLNKTIVRGSPLEHHICAMASFRLWKNFLLAYFHICSLDQFHRRRKQNFLEFELLIKLIVANNIINIHINLYV